jgi:hypothetical protein
MDVAVLTLYITSFTLKYLSIMKVNVFSWKIFSRFIRPISIKLDTNHPFIKGIQVSKNKRPDPL